MRPFEHARWLVALAGLLLWLAIPLIVLNGGHAKWAYRCRGREFTGEFDDCFNDYLPVLELFGIPFLILATADPFARFAFTLFSPPSEERSLKWRLGSRDGCGIYWPVLQVFAAVGLAWAWWRGLTYPPAQEMWPFHVYWGSFAAWFGLGIVVGWKDWRERDD